jgi:GH25 family lysozyme M1 (1,4-beta-N-acetylmuramidase)
MKMSVYDLSRYQPAGRIQELVNGGGCDGVILKLGEWYDKSGEIELDPMFITHVNEAVRCGLPYGIYIMSRANNVQEALHEAQWVNDRVAELLNGQAPELGVWWDLERPETKRDGIYEDTRAAILQLREWWGGNDRIGIYGSYSYFKDYMDMEDITGNNIPVWTAQYGFENSLREDYPYVKIVMWQFTTNNDYQDENIWYGF